MADITPSLQEIEKVNTDPELGTGEPAVVYNNAPLINQLNQNAQLNQANQWRRYTQFLNDYQERLKTRQDIADIQVADSDRDYLKKQENSKKHVLRKFTMLFSNHLKKLLCL